MTYNGSKLILLRPGFLLAKLKSYRAHSALGSETTTAVLQEYGLTLLKGAEVPPDGEGRSRSVVIETNAGKKLLKQYKSSVVLGAIEQEHSILQYLAQKNFSSSPRLVLTREGHSLVQREGARYILFDFVNNGFQYYQYILLPHRSRRFVRMAGKALARLHLTLADFTPAGGNPNGFSSRTGDRWHNLDWYLEKLDECRKNAPPGTQKLVDRAGELESNLRALDSELRLANLPRLTIHGDYGPHNLLFRSKHSPMILDFEIARLDWRALEVVNALWRFGKDSIDGLRRKKREWFFEAYDSRYPLTASERAALPALWNFSHTRRCILNWYEYYRTHNEFNRAKAFRHLEFFDWMLSEGQFSFGQ